MHILQLFHRICRVSTVAVVGHASSTPALPVAAKFPPFTEAVQDQSTHDTVLSSGCDEDITYSHAATSKPINKHRHSMQSLCSDEACERECDDEVSRYSLGARPLSPASPVTGLDDSLEEMEFSSSKISPEKLDMLAPSQYKSADFEPWDESVDDFKFSMNENSAFHAKPSFTQSNCNRKDDNTVSSLQQPKADYFQNIGVWGSEPVTGIVSNGTFAMDTKEDSLSDVFTQRPFNIQLHPSGNSHDSEYVRSPAFTSSVKSRETLFSTVFDQDSSQAPPRDPLGHESAASGPLLPNPIAPPASSVLDHHRQPLQIPLERGMPSFSEGHGSSGTVRGPTDVHQPLPAFTLPVSSAFARNNPLCLPKPSLSRSRPLNHHNSHIFGNVSTHSITRSLSIPTSNQPGHFLNNPYTAVSDVQGFNLPSTDQQSRHPGDSSSADLCHPLRSLSDSTISRLSTALTTTTATTTRPSLFDDGHLLPRSSKAIASQVVRKPRHAVPGGVVEHKPVKALDLGLGGGKSARNVRLQSNDRILAPKNAAGWSRGVGRESGRWLGEGQGSIEAPLTEVMRSKYFLTPPVTSPSAGPHHPGPPS